MSTSNSRKSHLVYDLLAPVVGLIAFLSLFWLTAGLYYTNHCAMHADKHGPRTVAIDEIGEFHSLTCERVEITDVALDSKFVESNTDGKTHTWFVVKNADGTQPKIPVVIRNTEINSLLEAEKFLKSTKITGTMDNFMGMNFDAQDRLEEVHPEINLVDAYILKVPAYQGSQSSANVLLGICCFWLLFGVAAVWWLYRGVLGWVRYGVTLKRDPVNNAQLMQRNHDFISRVIPPAQLEDVIDYDNRKHAEFPRGFHVGTVLGRSAAAVFFGVTLPMALAGKADLLPEAIVPHFYTSGAVSVVFTSATWQCCSGI